ncbi:hypothetical protein HPB48_015843 [Haemaphysalis longicornis]|uniref:Uncharacterized protein n=1 Tax=Haemaphysalis longicornis TaxID=44386 RepID=A0A9J6FR10_HAELO|nr:hypothetical protein HPB48_015843 [Haemaphysalis longicornis]
MPDHTGRNKMRSRQEDTQAIFMVVFTAVVTPKEPPPNLTDCIASVDGRAESVDKEDRQARRRAEEYKDQMAKMREGAQRKMYEQQRDKPDAGSRFNMEQANFATQTLKDTKIYDGRDEAGRATGMPEVDDEDLEAELNALGDEIALDEDTSYLDEASAPRIPTRNPEPTAFRLTRKASSSTSSVCPRSRRRCSIVQKKWVLLLSVLAHFCIQIIKLFC